MEYVTRFGALGDYAKGNIEVIGDDPKNYVFSNVFEVAATSVPYERVAVAKNFEYVIETVRAEGVSPWYSTAHDEFALCMDGEVEVHLVKLADADAVVDPAGQGANQLQGDPDGQKMGRLVLRRGHMGMLPRGAAYRFQSDQPGVLLIQTVEGPVTVQKWAEICLTGSELKH